MKFIGGIQNFRIDNNSISIKLPYYHRAATGLLSGAEVYIYPKISTIKNANGQETQVKEIIISPFHPNDWYNIYELELIMDDKPGMINLITKILKEKNINIHIQESLITNDEQNFSVSLIVDVKDYSNSLKIMGNNEKNMHEDLSNSFKEISITLEKFMPCKQLRNNSKEVQMNKKTNYVENDTLKHFYSNNYHAIQIINKQLIIGKQIIQALFQGVDSNHEIQGTVFSDTNEKMIIVRFFNRDQHVVHFDIQHENKLGAIFLYSSLIKETSISYNIISCYNRIENTTETAHWYVLLDVSHDIEKLYILFSKLCSSSTNYVQKLIVHNYSRSIEYLNLSTLQHSFPSLRNLSNEKKVKDTDLVNEAKYREVLNEISQIKENNEQNKAEFKKAKTQFWVISLIMILICSYILAKIIPETDFEKMYFKIAAIGGGLMTIVHILVVYLELPKLLRNIFKINSNKIN